MRGPGHDDPHDVVDPDPSSADRELSRQPSLRVSPSPPPPRRSACRPGIAHASRGARARAHGREGRRRGRSLLRRAQRDAPGVAGRHGRRTGAAARRLLRRGGAGDGRSAHRLRPRDDAIYRRELRPRDVRRAPAAALRPTTSDRGTPFVKYARRTPRPARRGHASSRPVAEVAVGQDAEREPGSGSTQRNVPLPPKWPNVRGEFREPVQCGCFSSRSSKPRPQSFGSMRPKPGRTPSRPGNATVVASASVSGATSVGRSSSRAEREQVVERAVRAPRPASRAARRRARAARSTAAREVLGERHLGAPRDLLARAPRSPCSSRCGACPARAIGASPSNGQPGRVREQMADRRARRARPARRGRRRPPRPRRAPRARSTSFVTEAQRNSRSASPCGRDAPVRRDDAGRGVLGAPVVDLRRASTARRY